MTLRSGKRSQDLRAAPLLWAAALLCGCTGGSQPAGLGPPDPGWVQFGNDTQTMDVNAADVVSVWDAAVADAAAVSTAVDAHGDEDTLECTLGAARCGPEGREFCHKAGWAGAPCSPLTPACVDGMCLNCIPKTKFCADAPAGTSHSNVVMSCDDTGGSAEIVEACAEGPCSKGACLACNPGDHRCNEGAREVCAGGGKLWSPDHCAAPTPACVEGACLACVPSTTSCGIAGNGEAAIMQCDANGSSATMIAACSAPKTCSDGACVLCVPNSTACLAGALTTCKADGSGFETTPCPAATPACVAGACKLCEPGDVFCQAAAGNDTAAVMLCGPTGDAASAIKACDAGEVCHNNTCKACAPGGTVCVGNSPLLCAADGASLTLGNSCSDAGLFCGPAGCGCGQGDAGGVKSGPYCAPPAAGLAVSHAVWFCDASGKSAKKAGECTAGQVCAQGKCATCSPGAKRCEGNKAMFCTASGDAWQLAADCDAKGPAAHTCVAGKCLDLCALPADNPTNQGCRFWAVDLDNAEIVSGGSTFDAQNAPFGVVLINSGAKTAAVTITFGPGPGVPEAKTHQLNVAPGAAQTVVLPRPEWGLKPASLDGTSLQGMAFRIDSTAPVAAFQHNPLQANAFSADASMLLPANALGQTYRVLTRKQSLPGLRAYLAVAASSIGTTKVTITPTAATVAGEVIGAGTAGVPIEVSLQQGQVLNLETAKVGDDLTGTLVQANKPVALFAGAEAAHAPDTDVCVAKADGAGKVCAGTNKSCAISGDCAQTCCADHIEQQLPPISAWGTTYIAGQLQPRGAEPGVWRIVAAHNGTEVLFKPAVAPVQQLQAGQWVEVVGHEDVIIESNKSVLVGQFMASSGLTGSSLGDPAFMILPPVSALGGAARFWVPGTYGSNFVTVCSPSDAEIELDGKAQSNGLVSAGSGWSIWRLPVAAGVHEITSTRPIGAILHGWSKDGSYGHSVGHGVH